MTDQTVAATFPKKEAQIAIRTRPIEVNQDLPDAKNVRTRNSFAIANQKYTIVMFF